MLPQGCTPQKCQQCSESNNCHAKEMLNNMPKGMTVMALPMSDRDMPGGLLRALAMATAGATAQQLRPQGARMEIYPDEEGKLVCRYYADVKKPVEVKPEVQTAWQDFADLEKQIWNNQETAARLRQAGLNVVCYPEMAKLGKQFKFGDRMGMRVAVILGPDELENRQIAVKDLHTGKQEILPDSEAVTYIQNLLDDAKPS